MSRPLAVCFLRVITVVRCDQHLCPDPISKLFPNDVNKLEVQGSQAIESKVNAVELMLKKALNGTGVAIYRSHLTYPGQAKQCQLTLGARSSVCLEYGCRSSSRPEYIVAVKEIAPFVIFKAGCSSSLSEANGIEINLLGVLSNLLNISFRLACAKDGQWGSKEDNGNWTGMVGMVLRNEADLAVSVISLTSKRQAVVDFTVPYVFEPMVFISRAPGKLQVNGGLFLWPFQTVIWLCLIITILAAAAILQAMKSFIHESGQPVTFVFLASTIALQGLPRSPKHSSLRIFHGFWWFFVIVMASSYGGSLISSASFPLMETPLDTVPQLEEAVEKLEVSLGSLKGSLPASYLLNDKEGVMYHLGQGARTKPESLILDASEATAQVLDAGDYVYVTQRTDGQLAMARHGSHNFHLSKDALFLSQAGVAVRKGFPHLEQFNTIILHLLETGYFGQWYQEILTRIGGITGENQPPSHLLDSNDLSDILYFLFIGHGVAYIAFLLEMIWISKKTRHSILHSTRYQTFNSP